MEKHRIRTVKSHKVVTNWEEAVEEYLMFKKSQGLRDSTLTTQRQVLTYFFNRYPNAWIEDPKTFVMYFLSDNIKPATYNIRVSYLRSFYDWCRKEGLVNDNPVAEYKRRKADRRIVQIDEETIAKLIQLPDRNTYAGLRDYALILLTLDTGIRPKEALNLLLSDVNFQSSEVYIRPEVAKTQVSRTLPITPVTSKAIKRLIQSRHPAWNETVPLFASADGTKLNHNTWGDRLEMYSQQLGVRIRPYDLRHTFALYFLRNGGHALALQRLMGHSDLSMTKRYVALTDGDLRQQHDMASPAMKLVHQSKRVRKVRK